MPQLLNTDLQEFDWESRCFGDFVVVVVVGGGGGGGAICRNLHNL